MKHIVPLHKIMQSVRVFQSKNQHTISGGEKGAERELPSRLYDLFFLIIRIKNIYGRKNKTI